VHRRAVWVAQGNGALKGSGTSGEGRSNVIGALVIAVGLALLGWAWRLRRDRPRRSA